MHLILVLIMFGCLVVVTRAQNVGVRADLSFIGSTPKSVRVPLPMLDRKRAIVPGVVFVDVTINRSGGVSRAARATGPYPVCDNVYNPDVLAMRASALAAARKAKFLPATVNGQAVEAMGKILYTFEAPARSAATQARSGGKTKTFPTIVSDWPVRNRAKSLPQPEYPAAARAVRAGGGVNVHVVIAENGAVYSAEAISGHPLLRRASEVAACASEFELTRLSGQPVSVSTVITYNYKPGQ
jgi:hypothetical protein